MPEIDLINDNHQTRVRVWQVTEDEKSLGTGIQLADYSIRRLSQMKSSLHRRAYLSIRHLLKNENLTDDQIHYSDEGKPHLEGDRYISITHSYNLTAIITSNQPVGIDIEKHREKILNISGRFIGSEISFLEYDKEIVPMLTSIWGAKESVYKIFATQGLSFKQHCHIDKFTPQDTSFTGKVQFLGQDCKFAFRRKTIQDYSLVYALPETSWSTSHLR